MSEHMSPIPSRLYNAAVGGHVAGADQIIDDETGLTLDKVTGGALEEKTYTSGSDNGMGRVVLRKNLVEGVNTLVQTMINKSNTIYVIQYDFTLGEDITIPENCIFVFDGGSISGAYTITGTNTGIQAGLVKIFNTDITFAGTWVGEFNVNWIGTKVNDSGFDNGAILNTIPDVFNYIYIPRGLYYFSTPIVFNASKNKINCDGDFYYNGNSSSLSLITLDRLLNATIKFRGVIRNISESFSLVQPVSSVVGLDIKDCYGLNIYVNFIMSANECIRLYSTGAAAGNGCAYNNIYLGLLANCNTGIRLTSTGNGWVNQNNIFGGRIVCAYGAVTPYNMRRVVVDTNNTINDALTMVGVSMEGDGIGIYAKDLYGSAFVNCRFEGNTWAFYGEGQCRYNKLWSSDATSNIKVNLDNCKNSGIEQGFKPYANFILNGNESITLNRKSGSSRLQLFFQVTELEDNTQCRLKYDKDTDGNIIPASDMNDGTPPLQWVNNRVGYYNTYNVHFYNSIVTVPTNVQEFTLTAIGGKIAVNVMIL